MSTKVIYREPLSNAMFYNPVNNTGNQQSNSNINILLDKLHEEYSKQDALNASLVQEIHSLKVCNEQLESENTNLVASNKQLKSENTNLVASNRQLKSENASLNSNLESFNTTLLKLKCDTEFALTEKDAKISNIEDNLKQEISKLKDAENRVKSLSDEVSNLKLVSSKLRNERDSLKNELESNNLKTLQEEIKSLKEENSNLNSKLESNSSIYGTPSSSVDELIARVKELAMDLNNVDISGIREDSTEYIVFTVLKLLNDKYN